jgi:outer membrane protein assembly factor BamA
MPFNEDANGLPDFLLASLRDSGYVDAELNYTATIIPGDAFHLGTIAWQPTAVYSQDAFAHDAKLHGGDVVSQSALLETEQSIVNAYLHLGYLDAYVDAHAQKDATAHTVSYALEVVPGEVYHLKSVTALNLSAAAQQDFDRGWLLRQGAVYDPLYTAKFLTSNTALQNLAGYTASFRAAADSQTHLVDLTINFVRAGGR